MVDLTRFELVTSRLSAGRSNQLSYRSIALGDNTPAHWPKSTTFFDFLNPPELPRAGTGSRGGSFGFTQVGCETAWVTIFGFMRGESKNQEPHLEFTPVRLGLLARLGQPAWLRPPGRLELPAGLRPLDCDGLCSFGGVIESCSPHLEFGCSCDRTEKLPLSLVFQFLFRSKTASCQLQPNHRPPRLHMLGPRREEGGSDGQTKRLWRQDSHSKHRPGARARRIAQMASESNQRKGHEAAHAHDCRGDFRPCYRCTPLLAQTGMGCR